MCSRVPLKCVRDFHVAVQERLKSMLAAETPTSMFSGEAREWITGAMGDTQHMSMDERGGGMVFYMCNLFRDMQTLLDSFVWAVDPPTRTPSRTLTTWPRTLPRWPCWGSCGKWGPTP